MSRNLYFLTLCLSACQAPDPQAALQEAFREIVRRGAQPGYRRGFAQFQRWMHLIAAAHRDMGLAGPKYPRRAGQTPDIPLGVTLEGPSGPLVSGVLRRDETLECARVNPGAYRLMLHTGWCIWDGVLAPADLLWSAAPAGAPLPAAAGDADTQVPPTRTIDTPAGLVLELHRGHAYGRLVLRLAAPEIHP